MALETFGDAWRKVRLHTNAPFGLCREWTQHAYEDLVKRRPWNFARIHAILSVPASRTVTVVFALNSVTVTCAAATVSASDIGRQIRLAAGTMPIYTIQTVASGGASFTIDMAYADPATVGSQSAQIITLYQTMPADFGAFLLITDPYNQRLISWWHTQEQLGRVDPLRSSTDTTCRVLVSRSLSSVPSLLGRVQYEWWPGPTAAKQYPYYYRQQAASMADTDPLLGVVTSRTLELGALARCAQWPGTADQKNPYFNLALHTQLQDEFDHACAALELRDDDQNQITWSGLPEHRWATWDLAFDTSYLRSTDASLGDYRSSGF